jgi:hypothetical protein
MKVLGNTFIPTFAMWGDTAIRRVGGRSELGNSRDN